MWGIVYLFSGHAKCLLSDKRTTPHFLFIHNPPQQELIRYKNAIIMDRKLQDLLPAIKERLEQPDIRAFKIGKSKDARRRFSEYEEPFHYLGIIAKGNADAINQAECDLIDYFKGNAKCTNENAGGGGYEDATELYIVARKNGADHREHLLDPTPLFGFKTLTI